MARFRIVFMGTPEFACPSLEALTHGPDEIVCVVTQPDKPRGRGRHISPCPVKSLATQKGLDVLQPAKARQSDFIDQIKALQPDLLVVAAYGQILPQALLDVPTIMPINVHGSLLPAYRGAAPIQWAILNGERETGITIMRMDAGMDTGAMLLKEAVEIGLDETYGGLYQRLSILGARILMQALELIDQRQLTETPQPLEGVILAPPIKPEMAKIDWTLPASKLACQIRAFDPSPGAFTYLCGQKIKLFTPKALASHERTIAGKVISTGRDGMVIACGDGAVLVKEVLLPGKKRMSVADVLRGKAFCAVGDICQSID